jgi:hypothetical protein
VFQQEQAGGGIGDLASGLVNGIILVHC